MGRILGLIAVAVALWVTGFSAQTPKLTFDVASIRIRPSVGGSGISIHPAGLFRASGVTLKQLVERAYGPAWNIGLSPHLVVGGLEWAVQDRFDVQARAPQDGVRNDVSAVVPLMVRSLLADRFRLRIHHEKRQIPLYELRLARPDQGVGPCMRLHKDPAQPPFACPSKPGLVGMSLDGSMAEATNLLSVLLDKPVIDRTGLNGSYFMSWAVRPDQVPGIPLRSGVEPSIDGPTWPIALREQLGLQLESTLGRVNVVVIDSAQRPTEN